MLPRRSQAAQTPEFAKVFCFFSSEKKSFLPMPTLTANRGPTFETSRRRADWVLPASALLHALMISLVLLARVRETTAPPPETPGFAMLWDHGVQLPDAVPVPGARPSIPAGENARSLQAATPVPPPAAPKQESQAAPAPEIAAKAPKVPQLAPGAGPLPRRAAQQRAQRANPFAHATDLRFSQAPRSAAGGRLHGSRSMDLSMGLHVEGGQLRDAVPHVTSPGADGDYIERLSEYIEVHKFYPERAAANGEDGVAVLRATIARDGTVKDVELEQSSGSNDLDDAWLSLFRHKRLAPFPDDMNEAERTFEMSMDYILLRG